MAIFFAGTTWVGPTPMSPGDRTGSNSTARQDSDYSTTVPGGNVNDGFRYFFPTPQTGEVWVHWHTSTNQGSSTTYDGSFLELFDADGTGIVRIRMSNGTINFEGYDGTSGYTVYESGGSPFTLTTQTYYDFRIVYGDSGGQIDIYEEEVLIRTVFMNTDGMGTCAGYDYVEHKFVNTFAYYAGRIIADENTVGWRVNQHFMSTVGDVNTWQNFSGTIADLDVDIPTCLPQIDTGISSDSAGQEFLAYPDNLRIAGIASTLSVASVFVHAYVKRQPTGPQSIQLGIKPDASSMVDYAAAQGPASLGFESITDQWTLNPDTGQQWTTSEVDALQVAIKSVT